MRYATVCAGHIAPHTKTYPNRKQPAMVASPAAKTKSLELTVSDFGPIAEGRVELRPMTVFVGPSNTGKSYLAILIYALHRFFGAYSAQNLLRIRLNPWLALQRDHIFERDFTLSEDDIEALLDWAKEIVVISNKSSKVLHEGELPGLYMPTSKSVNLPGAVEDVLLPILNNVSHLGEIVADEIIRCFGTDDVEKLIRYQNSESKVSLWSSVANNPFNYEFATTEHKFEMRAPFPLVPKQIDTEYFEPELWRELLYLLLRNTENIRERVNRNAIASQMLAHLVASVVSYIVRPFAAPVHYLPADRAGVMHAHQIAVRGIIDRASRIALRSEPQMPTLSGVLGDFLSQLVELADQRRTYFRQKEEAYGYLASNLERQIMRGRVRVEQRQISYPSFVYRPTGWKRNLPLMNVSSMVSELAPVALYLRHVVQPGDLLIIEEPEAHLHPQMQVEFTRLLASAVQAGVRILITTHSEWVLEELANLVRLSELPPERRQGLDDPDISLTPDQVGAWLFEHDAERKGSVVKEINLEVDAGTFPSGFGLVTEDLYNRWAEISNRIEEG